MTNPIPRDVVDYVRNVFVVCNRRIGRKIAAVPNASEQSLDLTMIEHLSQYSAPTILPSDWTVRIDIHYLGGRRHFDRWEVADIGVLLFLRRAGKLVRSKVALFQSKRLYPDSGDIDEEEAADYHVGFARLVPDGSGRVADGDSACFLFLGTIEIPGTAHQRYPVASNTTVSTNSTNSNLLLAIQSLDDSLFSDVSSHSPPIARRRVIGRVQNHPSGSAYAVPLR